MQKTGLNNFLTHLEDIAGSSEERHGLSDIKTDWQQVHDQWLDHMKIEAASIGYDFAAGRSASTAYIAACIAFQAKHGVDFDPYGKPE